MEINKKYTIITEGSRRDHGGIKEGALMIKLLEKLCSIDIQKDVEAALLAFHDAFDCSVVCASLHAVDLPEILHRDFYFKVILKGNFHNMSKMDFPKGTPCQFFFGLQLFLHFFGAQPPKKGGKETFKGGTHVNFWGDCNHLCPFLLQMVGRVVMVVRVGRVVMVVRVGRVVMVVRVGRVVMVVRVGRVVMVVREVEW